MSLKRYDTDEGLRRLYNRLNKLWFHSQLPDDTIVRWRSRLGAMGMHTDPENGDPSKIELDVSIRSLPRVIEWVLLHECAHCKVGYGERAHHGPKWRREIKRLVRAGAYEGLF